MRDPEVYTLPEAAIPLTEEMMAVTMAKCSRNPKSFREIAKEITEEQASTFHEKYVHTYGHASVAEGAVPMVCFENVSIIASKVLEAPARPSYQEKSTRYQEFDENAVYVPKLETPSALSKFSWIVSKQFNFYRELLAKLMLFTDQKVPQDAKNRAGAVKGRAFDSARYCLPAGTQTNLAMRINALDAARLISSMRAHYHREIRELAEGMATSLEKVLPTLIRHAEADTYQQLLRNTKSQLWDNYFSNREVTTKLDGHQQPGVHLLDFDRLAMENILAQLMYHPPMSLEAVRKIILDLPHPTRFEWFNAFMKGRGEFDPMPEAWSGSTGWRWDIQMDYGAFRDLQRHRRLYQNPQRLTTYYGFVIPDDVEEIGMAEQFRDHMEKTRAAIDVWAMENELLFEDEYLIPLAFLHRTAYTMDLREAAYIIELRSKPAGHISYRRIVNQMWADIAKLVPLVSSFIRNVEAQAIGVHS